MLASSRPIVSTPLVQSYPIPYHPQCPLRQSVVSSPIIAIQFHPFISNHLVQPMDLLPAVVVVVAAAVDDVAVDCDPD